MRKIILLSMAVMLLAACGQAAATASPTTTPAPATGAPATTAPIASVAPAVRPTPGAATPLSITTSDQKQLAGDYYAPVIITQVAGQKAPAVLLLVQYGASRTDWRAFAHQLQAQGIAALAIDLRGQGSSAGPEDWSKGAGDVAAAWQALLAQPGIDPQRTAIVGASIGANLALVAGGDNAQVAAVVALSPGDVFLGVAPTDALPKLGSRPVYLIASKDDGYSYDSVGHMAPHLAAGETFFYANSGHGMAMFSNPDLATRLLSWLGVHIGNAKG